MEGGVEGQVVSPMVPDSGTSDSLPHADRRFYDLPVHPCIDSVSEESSSNILKKNGASTADDLCHYIENSVIGKEKVFSGPYGLRTVLYCDYTASGRALSFIEDYVRDEVLPEYGNTHTTTTVTSLQTTLFRHEARDIIRNAVNASEHDAVVFVGSGCTSAVHKLIHALKLTRLAQPPVVFVDPYAHHSSLLPWRELGGEVIRILETDTGLVDVNDLQTQLQLWQGRGRQLIGCFAAASNISGIVVDVDQVTVTLHRYGAMAFWDYATAAPYAEINMNPGVISGDPALAYKDAVFLSVHKFVGGVQTPGVLIAKKKLFVNPVPSDCGGGSVFFVRREAHRYLQETEVREEGGTPAIVESVRAGLVFQLKEAVGVHNISTRDEKLSQVAFSAWKEVEGLVLLGSHLVPRLPIFSFLIKHVSSGLFLHHNFICAILNDVFGIQARGGCACAGPYAQDVLGISEQVAMEIENLLVEDSRLDRVHLRRYREYSDKEIIRPGFARLNLPYFMSAEARDFVIEAVKLTAEHAWKLLPQYKFNPETGEWRHRNHQVFKDRKWLGFISYQSAEMRYSQPPCPEKGPLPSDLQDCLQKARQIFQKAEKVRVELGDQRLMFPGEAGRLRWFLLPSEALYWLKNPKEASSMEQHNLPFCPPCYPLSPRTGSINSTSSIYGAENLNIKQAENFDSCPSDHGDLKEQTLNSTVVENKTVQTNNNLCSQDRTTEKSSGTVVHVLHGSEVKDESFQAGLRDYLSSGFVGCDIKPEVTNSCVETSNDSKLPFIQANSAAVDEKLTSESKPTLSDPSERDASVLTNCNTNDTMTNQTLAMHERQPSMTVGKHDVIEICDNSHLSELTKKLSGPGPSISKCDDTIEKSDSETCVSDEKTSPRCAQKKASYLLGKDDPGRDSGTAPVTKQADCEDGKCFLKRKENPGSQTVAPPSGVKWHCPPKKLFNPTIEAVEEHSMIHDGDRVLVCLSGGKDSLSLLHTLHQYQYYARSKGISFELGAVTVDPMTSSYDPRPLKPYLASLGVEYFYEEQAILEAAAKLPYECASICSFCSRMKRGRIYAAARRGKYNVLALGQHLDDLAESFLMSVFHNGLMRTMKACYSVKEGDLRVIRPFVYVREKDLRQFAEEKKLPIIPENCPACFEAPKERHRMKQLLASQEVLFPRLFPSLQAALRPLMAINRTGVNLNSLLTQTMQNKNNPGTLSQDEDDLEL